jgi:hypothetical protein
MSTSRILIGLLVLASSASAQASKIPVRQLPAPTTSTPAQFTTLNSIRHLSNGRVLVADPAKRLVWMYDANLQNPVIVIDSVAGKSNSYGSGLGALIPFAGDSTLFVDRSANIFLVLAPDGSVARVMPLPPGAAANYLTPTLGATFSPAFGVMFRAPAAMVNALKSGAPSSGMPAELAARAAAVGGGDIRMSMTSAVGGSMNTLSMCLPPGAPPPGPNDGPVTVKTEDTAYVMSMDAKTRALDPLTSFVVGSTVRTCTTTSMSSTSGAGLYPVFDQWAAAADGSIAILRAREYRLDFFNADRSITPGPRLPFDWKKNDDNEKQRLVDSVNASRRKLYEERVAQRAKDSATVANGGTIAPVAGRGAPGAGGAGGDVMVTSMSVGGAGGGGRGALPAGVTGGTRTVIGPDGQPMTVSSGIPPMPQPPAVADVNEIPDYMPAVFGSTQSFYGDADNNFWIRTRPGGSTAGMPTFDIINRKGELIDRVQLPEGRTVVGFGKGGFVYMVARDAGMAKLEKTKVR